MPSGRKMEKIEVKSAVSGSGPAEAGKPGRTLIGKEFPSLHEIRDRTLMLSVGNAFLCEEAFLKKTGSAIDSSLGSLRQEIQDLEMKFPGKFTEESDTESIFENLHAHAQRLQNPDSSLMNKCTTGALGRELEEILNALTSAVRKTKKKVAGETPPYTAKDSVLGALDKAKAPLSMASRLISLFAKAVLVLLVLSLGPFTYLILTMDKESALVEEIRQSEAHIRSWKEIVASSEEERADLLEKIISMQSDDVPREIKLEIMEMNVKMHSLDQAIHRAEAEITEHENRIKDRRRRVEEMSEKSFMDRLLRR